MLDETLEALTSANENGAYLCDAWPHVEALVAEVRRLKHQLAEEMAAHDETTERMNAAFLERDQQYHETRRYFDALHWYAEPSRWERKFTCDGGGMHYFVHDDIEDDLGKRARIALGREPAPESGEDKPQCQCEGRLPIHCDLHGPHDDQRR